MEMQMVERPLRRCIGAMSTSAPWSEMLPHVYPERDPERIFRYGRIATVGKMKNRRIGGLGSAP